MGSPTKTILVAPLNWGIGHATRCIPIIQDLLDKKHKVIIASDGAALEVLKIEFPELTTEELPSYEITYPKKGNFILHIVKLAPGILKAIKQERKLIKELMVKYQINEIISDNRYGIYHPDIKSVFITHQLHISVPIGNKLMSKVHNRFMKNFDEIWVPDDKGEPNLSGKLSHSKKPTDKVKYIGVLSRFSNPITELKPPNFPFTNDFTFILISGPEPQRSIFENLVYNETHSAKVPVVIVGGDPGSNSKSSSDNCIHYPFLTAPYIKWLIQNSSTLICRSGYSSLMDLMVLKKPAILVSTPGQTEQEYLAEKLGKTKMFTKMNQKEFDLNKAVREYRELVME